MTPDLTSESTLEARLLADIGRRARYTWLMYAVFCAFVAPQPQIARWPLVTPAAIILILILGAVRVWSGQRLQPLEGEPARKAERAFIGLIALQIAVWSGFVAFAFRSAYGSTQLELCLVIGVTGFATTGAAVLAGYPPLAYAQVAFQVLPVLVWSFAARERIGYMVLTFVICFIVFIVEFIRASHWHLVAMFRAQLQLEMQSAELKRAKETAENASLARARFITNMSHEIRTPLHGMLGVTEILARNPHDGEQEELLGTLRRSGAHLLEIVNDILDFSRIASGRLAVEAVPFDPAQLVHEVAAPAEAQAHAKALRFVSDLASLSQGFRRGDPLRLRQVLANLLSNAVKFTASGEVRLRVESLESGRIRFSVDDTGIGIDETQIGRLFQEFTQADTSTTRRFGGSGLGLAISKHLVEAMQGELTVTSRPGIGSTFAFEIPLPEAPQPPTFAHEPAAAVQQTAGALQGRRILLAEDNAVNRLIVERYLEGTGLTVETAGTGRIAVERHAADPFDLILMDCHMPDMDGFEAAAAIRASDRAADVPILAVTASAFSEDRERCHSAGMNGFVSKPLSRETLLKAIASEFAKNGDRGRAARDAVAPIGVGQTIVFCALPRRSGRGSS